MESHQNESSSTGLRGRIRFLILITVVVLSSGFLSYSLTAHLAKKEHATRLEELTSLIESHRSLLEVRDIDSRGLKTAWDSFTAEVAAAGSTVEAEVSSAAAAIKAGASSLLPNTTVIFNSVVSLVSGGGNISTIVESLQQPANSLGVGLSSGAIKGLNITMPKSMVVAMNKTGLSGLALNLGSGLTSTIFSSTNFSSLVDMNPNQPGGLLGGSTGTVGKAALALAQGLGGGAIAGLKTAAVLNTSSMGNMPMSFNTSGVNGLAGNFGQGLSQAFLSGLAGVQLPTVQSLMASLGTMNTTINFADVGAGVGTGIGQGAVVGFGLQPDVSMDVSGAAGVAQGFTKGLVSSFLINGTASKLVSMVSATGGVSALFGMVSANANASAGINGTTTTASASIGGINVNDISVAKVAEGFAVGLISGAGSTFMSLRIISADTTNFDDSVQGASAGFGRGLGVEGSKIVQMVLNGAKIDTADMMKISTEPPATATQMPAAEIPASDPATAPVTTPMKRGIRNIKREPSKRTSAVSLQSRAPANVTNLAGVLNNLNASAINPLTQYGIDTLTCTGVGGLVGVGYGLLLSGAIPTSNISIKDIYNSMTKSFQIGGQEVTIPDTDFVLKNEGNTYMLNPSRGVMNIMVNSVPILRVILLAVLHIFLAVVVYVAVIPSLLILRSNDKFTALIFQPGTPKPAAKRWMVITTYAMLPLALISFGAGITLRGNAKHFSTLHGIIGFIVIIQTCIAGITYPIAMRRTNPKIMLAHKFNIGVLLTLSTTALITGISDLQSLAFCALSAVISPSVWASVGGVLMMQLAVVQGLESLNIWLWWVARKVRLGKGESVGVRVLDGNNLDIKKVNNLNDEKRRPSIEKLGLVDDANDRSSFRI